MPLWLLRLIPVAGSAAVLAAMFPIASQKLDLDNLEEDFPTFDQLQPTSETTTPKPRNGRWTATNIDFSQGTNRGDGKCHIYTGSVWSMTGDSLILDPSLKYHDSIDKAKTASGWDGSVQCDSNRHFYVWKSSFGKWEIRSSSTAPQQS
ncbi:hypothetical protein HF1_04020 [Mycoplasma haemofelis str. Langford 1]|uniref:Uncharacterized protein n=1 Tax=Mycoplasma haemofelis (strain Langford 1) TaxID=941640 RepID=E8ZGY9_MYCHL|nr:hypothetical protein [Mycoplasma haemofelis]CBY92410.1 hypothetical protein HF1_04020 [Mycoplasma haemofelis str. Langford 1]